MPKTILITGAGQGIGQAIAFRFASEGANLSIVSKDSPEQMKETLQGIQTRGSKGLAYDTDVRKFEELQKVVNATVSHFGGIDILINNTSAPCFHSSLHTTSDQFDLVQSTSVRAAFFLSQICFPYLKQSKNPHIINISPPLNLDVR